MPESLENIIQKEKPQLFEVNFLGFVETKNRDAEYLSRKEDYKSKLITCISEYTHFEKIMNQIERCIIESCKEKNIDPRTIDYYNLFVGGTTPHENILKYEDVEFEITPIVDNELFSDKNKKILTIKSFINFLYNKYFPNGVPKEESTYSPHSW